MRAAIYVRVSDPTQKDNYSLETQEDQIRAYCERQGYTVQEDHVYREVFTGAELWERPQLTILRQHVRADPHPFDVVVGFSIDRMVRDQDHIAIIDEECHRHGILLETVHDRLGRDPMSKLIRNNTAAMAEMERYKILERTRRGLVARAEKAGALLPAKRPTFGYRYQDKDRVTKACLVPDPNTSGAVQKAFGLALQGYSLRRIALLLDAEGVPTPQGAKQWRATSIRYMLTNRQYIGEAYAFRTKHEKNGRAITRGGKRNHGTVVVRPQEEWVVLPEGTIPPLVDAATFEAVQRQLDRNKQDSVRNSPFADQASLRAGYIRCGYCKHAMHVKAQKPVRRVRKENDPRRYLSYVCGYRVRGETAYCSKATAISVPYAEETIWSLVRKVVPSIQEECRKRQTPEIDVSISLEVIDERIRVLLLESDDIMERIKKATVPELKVRRQAEYDEVEKQLAHLYSERRVAENFAEEQEKKRARFAKIEEEIEHATCETDPAFRRHIYDLAGVQVWARREEDCPGRLTVTIDGKDYSCGLLGGA